MVPTKRDSEIKEFQSTLPVWGRPLLDNRLHIGGGISIHPPREGRDFSFLLADCRKLSFQSTLPVRGGTLPGEISSVFGSISIHPPRGGRDNEG